MDTYFRRMKLLHISYAAFGNENDEPEDYVRARRYPVSEERGFEKIEVPPDYLNTGLFKPGVPYHMTAVKAGREAFMEVTGDGQRRLFAWDLSAFEPLTRGRIGLRQMWTRCSRYANFTVDVS